MILVAIPCLHKQLITSELLERKIIDSDPENSQASSPAAAFRASQDATTAGSYATAAPTLEALSILAQEIRNLNSSISAVSSTIAPRLSSPAVTSQLTDINGNGKRSRLSTNDQLAEGPMSGLEMCSEPSDYSLVFLTGDNLQSLLDVYFKDIHPWIPMIHTATFQRRIRERTNGADIPLILHAILVGALRLLDDKEHWLPIDRVQQQIRQSRAKVILSAGDHLSVENLQALIIIAFTHVSSVFPL